MTQKLLISTDRNGIAEFQKAVQATCDAANSLIELYHTFQPWQRITTVEDFITLATDPADYFDSTLLDNVEFKARGVTPDPGRLAELVGIHRSSFLNLCSGLNIPDEEGCKPCGKVRIKRGQRAISLSEFNRYSQYLTFTTAGIFIVNSEAVDSSLDMFNTYATSEEELTIYNLYHDTVKLLNRITELSPITPAERQTIKTALKLHLTEGHQGSFMVNTETLKNAINKLKYTNHGN